jgi:oxepin-CoA hydrolase/3-oxo-5,6-dehydrosuberyl-CoA semialdehyde dehydrogenase
MAVMQLSSFSSGQWIEPAGNITAIESAVTGDIIAEASAQNVDFEAMCNHARDKGGKALRAMTFHQRAEMLKALAKHLNERRDALYQLSYQTGATLRDSQVDIDGGIATLFVYSSKGRRELPNSRTLLDGDVEALSRGGSFIGHHIFTPLKGVALHINAFNFPVWGMLEKLAPAILAGVPAIVKPATDTSYLTYACFQLMIESGIFPEGTIQLVVGRPEGMLDHLNCQDVVAFTGSADTAEMLSSNINLRKNSTRFTAETDSLNASILGPDAVHGTPEFDLFIREVVREMTIKAGQKCTAIRRAIVPRSQQDAVIDALKSALAKITIGDPALETTKMGALSSQHQRRDVQSKIDILKTECTQVFGSEDFEVSGADAKKGAFISPVLLHCDSPKTATKVHEVEAFGPVSTVMPYDDVEDAIALANRGLGSLVASVFTHDATTATEFLLGAGSFHGRMLFADRDSAKESAGHGSPMPHLVHGGPGRAGGGEELGGIRGVKHYMQRTAVQGSPRLLSAIGGRWFDGAPEMSAAPHPFRLTFNQLEIGKTIHTEPRTITLDDIEHFAKFSGDNFYAHMDEEAAKANPFFPGRVAHGYLLLSFAAGLFVDPAPGPVLANYGLDNLRFLKPVPPGDSIRVRLTAMEKSQRNEEYGEVRWDVEITNQDDEPVAKYELLTMNTMGD